MASSQGMARVEKEATFGPGPQDTAILLDRIRAVCLIRNKITNDVGSGFFSKVNVDGTGDIYGIFTCNHVLGSELEAETADVVFAYEGNMPGEKVQLKPKVKFLTNKELDYTFIGINKEDIANLKCYVEHQIQPIIMEPILAAKPGDKVIIFQHPGGESKKWSTDTILRVEKPFLLHKADTEHGSSGSPVLTCTGHKLIAIHHGGYRGAYNIGTLCCEVLNDITTENYTKPGGAFSSSANPDHQPTEGFSKSNDEPSDQELNRLSHKICVVWQSMGVELEVPTDKIYEIAADNFNPGLQNKAFKMLMEWKNRGKSVTYEKLCRALEQHGLNTLAKELRTGM